MAAYVKGGLGSTIIHWPMLHTKPIAPQTAHHFVWKKDPVPKEQHTQIFQMFFQKINPPKMVASLFGRLL